jgi:predicted regulator of Ras-like GTPase activity (Roadblock/LC7/MglB family)
LRRFYKDFVAKDGQISTTNLEKAVDINQRNYKALVVLAKFYMQIGAIKRAEDKLTKILRFAPDDDKVKEMLETCKKIAKPSYEDVDILLHMAEEQRRLYFSLEKDKTEGVPSALLSPDFFQTPLESLKNSEGLLCLLICSEEGKLIAHYAKENIDITSLYEVASSIYQIVQDSSRQMDMGRFQRCQIDGPWGTLHIIGAEGLVYAGVGTREVKQEQISKYVQHFISKVAFMKKGLPNA